jgi:hypothetical protein
MGEAPAGDAYGGVPLPSEQVMGGKPARSRFPAFKRIISII